MTEILRNQVLNLTSGCFPVNNLVRVLWISAPDDRVVLIQIDQTQRKSPQMISLNSLRAAMGVVEAKAATLKPDPRSLMSDEQLATLYPNRSAVGHPPFVTTYRSYWWSVIEPIVREEERYFLGLCSLSGLIMPRSRELGISKQRIYQILYRYWAAGSVISAILPHSSRCGGKGKSRVGKQIPLGRKTLSARRKDVENSNYPLSEEDIYYLQFGWRNFIKKGIRVNEAYERMLRTYYASHWEQRNDSAAPVPILKESVPTLMQFRYHGERQDGGQKAWRMHLSELDWQMNHRPMAGKTSAGHRRIGAIGQADASPNDVHLVSMFDRKKIVGTCSWELIGDESIGMITGLYVGWTVDGEAAKLAMLNSASSKVDYCARYGIQITEDEFPKAHFNTLLVDRGEFNSMGVRKAMSGINTSLEYVQTGRGDLKPQVEAMHHTLHAITSHRLPGTTRGKHRGRGESDPALDACLNIHEFTADLIRAIIYHNTKAPVPHLLSTEMLQDGVQPTRMSIWQWARKKGYVAYMHCEEDQLITNLCPTIEGVVQADGVRLIAKNRSTGGYEVIVKRLRYLGPIAEQRNWLETARRRGKFRIQLYHNPYDLRQVWYLDPEAGLQALHLVTNDPLLEEATLHDLLFYRGELAELTQQVETEARQERVEMGLERDTAVKNAQDEKKQEIQKLLKKPSKRSLLENRRDNRADEIAQSGKASTPLTQMISEKGPQDEPTDTDSIIPEEMPPDGTTDKNTPDPYKQWLDEGDAL